VLSRNSVPAGAEHCPVSKTHHIVSMSGRKFAKMRGLCNCIASNPNKLERFPRQVVSTAQYSFASPNSLTLSVSQFRVKTGTRTIEGTDATEHVSTCACPIKRIDLVSDTHQKQHRQSSHTDCNINRLRIRQLNRSCFGDDLVCFCALRRVEARNLATSREIPRPCV